MFVPLVILICFLIKSPAISPTSLFFILFSFLQWNLHALVYIQPKYIQNQEVYYFEKSIYKQFNAFSTKKIVSSKLKYYVWCFDSLILTGWHLKNVILF